MKKLAWTLSMLTGLMVEAKVPLPPPPVPRPHPVIVVEDLRTNEKEIEVKTSVEIVESNAYYRFERTTFTFTNPNGRTMTGELQFPVPEGGAVCGYALEINGEMVPGAVVGKEAARVAFENEMRKGVDPGLVEHVRGNFWKTRIFPLVPNTPRKATVTCLVPNAVTEKTPTRVERDGESFFEAKPVVAAAQKEVFKLPQTCWIFWDASASFAGEAHAAARELVASGPETGDWQLVVFRNVPEKPVAFTSRKELLAAIDAVQYDGGTDLSWVKSVAVKAGVKKVVFSDELDTLSEQAPDLAGDPSFVLPLRKQTARSCVVRKLPAEEVAKLDKGTVPASKLLATAWAANRIDELSTQAEARKDEFLALGRAYGVASPVTSILVLESVQQWLDNKLEPPKELAIHAEWAKLRAAMDDPIAAKRAKAEHEQALLRLWEERVTWWKNPIPPRKTPRSGVFEESGAMVASSARRASNGLERRAVVAPDGRVDLVARMAEDAPPPHLTGAPPRRRRWSGRTIVDEDAGVPMQMAAEAPMSSPRALANAQGPKASVALAKWDPKMPYIEALKSADKGQAYAVYLKERATYAKSPAFFLDCAGWFFKAGEQALGLRIISNLAEMKLEDAALWRTMGWRLREAGAFDETVRVFRHVLRMRGEETQSRRDLALVLMERGKETRSVKDLEEAMTLLKEAAFLPSARQSGRRSNDMQTSIVALEELNGLLAWCDAQTWDVAPKAPELDADYRRDLPLKLRIVLSWDADETDIDLHVLEAEGEEAFYGHRRTSAGGFVSEDVTTGYGPEEYLRKECAKGAYKVMSNYYASHQTSLTGATCVTATVYTDWGTAQEKRQILTLRLDKPKDKHLIGTVTLE